MFWKRFIQEYLPMLNIRKKWNREKRDFKENDLVIMKNEHQQSFFMVSWPNNFG